MAPYGSLWPVGVTVQIRHQRLAIIASASLSKAAAAGGAGKGPTLGTSCLVSVSIWFSKHGWATLIAPRGAIWVQ